MRGHARGWFVLLASVFLFLMVPQSAGAGPARAWGRNYYGQVGDGSGTDRYSPVAVTGTDELVAVAAGESHSLVVHRSGTIYAFGRNQFGQLGDGTTDHRYTPVAVLNISTAVAVAGGEAHSLAADASGNVWTWGRNQYGQLGDGTTNTRHFPQIISGVSNVVAVAAGQYHSLALKADGTVWAWGRNYYGQLGDGTTIDRHSPVQIQDLDNVVAIACGFDHSLAVKADGTVWAWGRNLYGALGDGTQTDRSTPVQVRDMSNAIAVAAGEYHSLALMSNGTVWAWGRNLHGQLGDNTNTDRYTPVQVVNLTDAVAIGAGEDHSLAVRADGTARAWGRNTYGQLGDGTTDSRKVPVAVSGLTDAILIAGGYEHSVAILRWRTSLTVPDRSGTITGTVQLQANLRQVVDNTAVNDKTIQFKVDGSDVGSAVTGATGTPGRADLDWVIPEGPVTRTIEGLFQGDANHRPSSGSSTLTCQLCPTEQTVPDREGTITETVTLQAYLRRTTDGEPLDGRTVHFGVDGSWLGSAVTGAGGVPGRADFDWVIPDGPASRSIVTVFEGDVYYESSEGSGTLTCLKWSTKMVAFDRTQRITRATELKCRLVRSDNEPVKGKSVEFYVAGTLVGTRTTDNGGYARMNYQVPDGAGAREDVIRTEWKGDAGYDPSSATATLTVQKAIPYIWVLQRSAEPGRTVQLYAYFRRLYDYKPQGRKRVSFILDGTWIADAITTEGATGGAARYAFDTSGLAVGIHDLRCEFAGDAWLEPGYGSAPLAILIAEPLIWVQPLTVRQGDVAKLYAYVRRLYDLMPQENKRVSFVIDERPVGEAFTGTGADAGKARLLFPTDSLPPGRHTIRCKFEGDPTLKPGFAEAPLIVEP